MFIDDEQLALIEKHMQEKGYLEATTWQTVFNLLRANDLIWGFVVNNYLLGREPLAVRPAVLECRRHAHAGT